MSHPVPMPDKSNPPLRIECAPNGPLLVKGTVTVVAADGSEQVREGQCALCRCGHSNKKPFCDGSHKGAGFTG